MRIIDTVSSLKQYIATLDSGDIGFVPTMGALHDGHISLVKRSMETSAITVVSIFVNPTQFNDPEDLRKYPRNLDNDKTLLEEVLTDRDILFIPTYDDLYGREKELSLDLGGLDEVMEGKHRPGHFNGVVRVVKLLFEAVQPARAFFGQKDFQQLTIIKKMVDELGMDIQIVSCPILREANGLAMSSRNNRLSNEMRQKAEIIYKTLSKYRTIRSQSDIPSVEHKIINDIEKAGVFKMEYFEIVDNVSLTRVSADSIIDPGRRFFACIAVFAGEIRLIDNIEFSFQFVKG